MATTGTVPAWESSARAAWALALCRCVRAACPVAADEAAAGPEPNEEGASAAWWMRDESAARPDVDEEDARDVWLVVDDDDAAGLEAGEQDASDAARMAGDDASSGTTCALDLRRMTTCKPT